MTGWNFACADWEQRLREGRSLVPDLLTFSGALLSVFVWIYVELSHQSKELSNFRVQAAQSYVTIQALEAVEKRSREDKVSLQKALDKKSVRFDRSLEKMERDD